MNFSYPLDPAVRRLLPLHNADAADRAQGWTDWYREGGSAPVLKYIRWANGTQIDDEEILQETLIVAYTKVEQGLYEQRDVPFSAFLKKIAWFKIMEAARRRSDDISLDDLMDDHLADEHDRQAAIETWKEQEALNTALEQLPPRRSHIVLMYERGYSTAEIAQQLGIREALVRKEKSLGLRQLRQTLDVWLARAG